jgi:hypothetical protein
MNSYLLVTKVPDEGLSHCPASDSGPTLAVTACGCAGSAQALHAAAALAGSRCLSEGRPGPGPRRN